MVTFCFTKFQRYVACPSIFSEMVKEPDLKSGGESRAGSNPAATVLFFAVIFGALLLN